MQCFIISISINHRTKEILKTSYKNVIIYTDIQRDDRKTEFYIFRILCPPWYLSFILYIRTITLPHSISSQLNVDIGRRILQS